MKDLASQGIGAHLSSLSSYVLVKKKRTSHFKDISGQIYSGDLTRPTFPQKVAEKGKIPGYFREMDGEILEFGQLFHVHPYLGGRFPF